VPDRIERISLEQSDVISFHTYDGPEKTREMVRGLSKHGRPILDSGYFSGSAVQTVETNDQSPTVYAAMKRQSHGRSIAQLEVRDDPPPPPRDAPVAERMAHRLDTAEGRQLYGLRKETVEPVFGIIKQAIGFRRFLLRGKEKAGLEWTLVTTSYNLKRLFNLGMSVQRV
jgi:hypothetical protein